jgi:hypothetical protein
MLLEELTLLKLLHQFIAPTKKCKKTEEQKVEVLKKKIFKPIVKALNTLDTLLPYNDFIAWATKCQTFYDNQQE